MLMCVQDRDVAKSNRLFGIWCAVIISWCTPFAPAQTSTPAVFVVNNVSDEITPYHVLADGTLEYVGSYTTSDGPMVVALSPDGRYLAVTHGTQNEIDEVLQIFEVGTDASLSMVLSTLVPNAPMAAQWLTNDILAVTETNFGGDNFVHVYEFSSDPYALTLIDSEDTGGFNTYLVLHPAGKYLYAQDSLYNTIHWLSVQQDGTLLLDGSLGTGGVYPLKLAITHGGEYLYAAGGISQGGHNVLGFQISGDGSLTALAGSPFQSPGQSPAYVSCSGDDNYLFVGHGTDATVRSFAIDENGGLTSTGYSFDVGLQGTVGDVKTHGDLLFVTDESTAIDGIKGIYSFQVHPNGSFSVIGDIYDTGGTRPEYIAVWPGWRIADLNDDGVVNIDDIFVALGHWGPCGICNADINRDGEVNIDDIFAILGQWGTV